MSFIDAKGNVNKQRTSTKAVYQSKKRQDTLFKSYSLEATAQDIKKAVHLLSGQLLIHEDDS
ncbi:hypothetical protein [Atopococcus tabaci]|uniref:hypothetical protein n=1 Tax=Atopococcus tabaci TaxID=269774 RepID=UPI0004215D2E|nr:hypothetical protein [Atopococcus tabaci]